MGSAKESTQQQNETIEKRQPIAATNQIYFIVSGQFSATQSMLVTDNFLTRDQKSNNLNRDFHRKHKQQYVNQQLKMNNCELLTNKLVGDGS